MMSSVRSVQPAAVGVPAGAAEARILGSAGVMISALGGAFRASAHTNTQADAINRGRQIVGNAGGGELNIHDRNGQIRAKDTIALGSDPRSSRG